MTRNRTRIRVRCPFTFGWLATQRPGQIHMAINGVKLCPTKGSADIVEAASTGEITAETACRRCFDQENLTLAYLENNMGPTMNVAVAQLLDRIGGALFPRKTSPVPQPTPAEREAALVAEEAAELARRKANRDKLAAFFAQADARSAA